MTDMTDKKGLYMEESIINSLKSLLSGRVNEILGEGPLYIPPIEFGQSGYTGLSGEFRQSRNSTHLLQGGCYATTPELSISGCERSEKERIIRVDAYSLTISFTLPEMAEGELFCYGYAAAVELALTGNPTLDGVASRAVITGKQYKPPKYDHCGEGWEVVLSLRITAEC
jgi:hypothetical protein